MLTWFKINLEATSVFYGHTVTFESTSTLLDWLSQVQPNTRLNLTSVEIKTYAKTSSRNALHMLADAKNLQRLRIDAGIAVDADPIKAAKVFYSDAYKFLESMSTKKGTYEAALNMLGFGKGTKCFGIKDKDGKKEVHRAWTAEEMKAFNNILLEKLK